MKIAASDLYQVYKLYFIAFDTKGEDNIMMANLRRFTSILRLNSFIVQRASNRRGEIKGIKLNPTKVKEIIQKGREGERI